MLAWPIYVVVLLVADPGDAEPIRTAADCEWLFGDAGDQQQNRERREQILEQIQVFENVIALTHRGEWKTPTPIQLRDIALAAVVPIDDDRSEDEGNSEREPSAHLHLQGFEHCPDGLYRLSVDASIGASIAIIGIVNSVVLLEADGELRYLLERDAEPPRWQVVYHWPYHLSKPTRPAAPARSPKRRNSKRRR